MKTKLLWLFTASLFTFIATGSSALANDRNRWFEVEVILFTRDIPYDSIREEFRPEVHPITYHRNRDLLTRFHYPDIKPLFYKLGGCSIEDKIAPFKKQYPSVDALIDTYMPYLSTEERAQLTKVSLPEEQQSQPIDAFSFNDNFNQPSELSQRMQYELEQNESQYDFYQANLDLNPTEPATDCNGQIHAFNWLDPLYEIRLDWQKMRQRNQNRSFDYYYDMYPRVIIAGERTHNNYVHLVSPANFKLRQIYRTLRRQPDIRPILHTAWRQPGVSPKRSRATRLYAGIDYSQQYDFQGNAKPDPLADVEYHWDMDNKLAIDYSTQASLQQQVKSEFDALQTDDNNQHKSVVENIEKVMAMIADGTQIDYRNQTLIPQQSKDTIDWQNQPEQVREIDGLFRIYIDSFNYLHIDAEFNVRREVDIEPDEASKTVSQLVNTELAKIKLDETDLNSEPQNDKQLANYHFKQTRRVISKQLHYFDHPYMGMIVQIRRHGW